MEGLRFIFNKEVIMKNLTLINNEKEYYKHCASVILNRDDVNIDTILFKSQGTGWEGRWKKNEDVTVRKMIDFYLRPPLEYPFLINISSSPSNEIGCWIDWSYSAYNLTILKVN